MVKDVQGRVIDKLWRDAGRHQVLYSETPHDLVQGGVPTSVGIVGEILSARRLNTSGDTSFQPIRTLRKGIYELSSVEKQ